MLPLHFGTDEQFAAVRRLFIENDFNEKSVCDQFDLRAVSEYRLDIPRPTPEEPPASNAEVLIRLFLEGLYVPGSELQRLHPQAISILRAVGLIQSGPEPDQYMATAAVVPSNDLFLVSDRWSNPDRSPFSTHEDIVYPGHIPNTQVFIESLPKDPCDSLLDIGTGTGVAALVAARDYAKETVAADIAASCTQCASFAARLNGLPNCQSALGSLFEAVEGRTFDRIIAHPPYVPVLKKKWTFHSGGQDGEDIIRGIITGLPAALRPGGSFHGITLGSDRKGAPWQDRIRGFLGEHGQEFDIYVIERKDLELKQFAERSALENNGGLREVKEWEAVFERLGITALVYGSIIIRRHAENRKGFSARRPTGRHTKGRELAWLVNWETAAHQEGILDKVLRQRLSARPNLPLEVNHTLEDSDWKPRRYMLHLDYPFHVRCDVHPWMLSMLTQCNGTHTTLEVLAQLQAKKVLPAGLPEREFAAALLPLISAGALETEEYRLPLDSAVPSAVSASV